MQRCDAFLMRAIGAAIIAPASFDTVTDNFATAVFAFRGQGVDGAFEAVEIMRCSRDNHLDRFVVFVSADFTTTHSSPGLAFRT